MDQMKYRIEVSVKDRGYCKQCKLYAMFYLYILLKTEKPECSDLNLIKIRFVNPLLYDTYTIFTCVIAYGRGADLQMNLTLILLSQNTQKTSHFGL